MKTPILTTTTESSTATITESQLQNLKLPTSHSAVKVKEVTTKRRLCAKEIEERINLMFRT